MLYLSVGDTAVIAYSIPILVVIMAHYCLGEKCGVVSIIVAITSVIGMGLIARPPILTGEAAVDTNALVTELNKLELDN